jgi:hypothetical protein
MKRSVHAPTGQALIESVVVIAAFASLLTGLYLIYNSAKVGHLLLESVRLDADRCMVAGQLCDASPMPSSYVQLLGEHGAQHATLLQRRAFEIRRETTLSNSDIAWSQGISRAGMALSQNFRNGLSGLFGLPETTSVRMSKGIVNSRDLSIGGPGRHFQLASGPDEWRSSGEEQERRVRKGAEPIPLIARVIEGAFFPTKDLLMPAVDFIGLEKGTAAYRESFHRSDWLRPLQGTTQNIERSHER